MRRILVMLFLCSLPVAAWSQEKQERAVTLALDDAKISAFAAEVARQAGVEVTVGTELRGKKITLYVDSLGVRDALTLIAALAGGKLVKRGEGRYHIGYERPKPEWMRRLEIQVRGEFPVLLPKQPLSFGGALAHLQRASGATIHMDPILLWKQNVLEHPVSIPEETLSTAQILDRITATAGVAWDLRWGLVFVSTVERLAEYSKSDGKPMEADYDDLAGWERNAHGYLNATLSFSFDNVVLPDALAAALRGTDFELEIPEEIRKRLNEIRVSFGGRDLTKRQILTALLVPAGFRFELIEKGIRIRPR